MVPPRAGDPVDQRLQRVGVLSDQCDREVQLHKADDQSQHRQYGKNPAGKRQPPWRLSAGRKAKRTLPNGSRERQEGEEVTEFGDQVVGSL